MSLLRSLSMPLKTVTRLASTKTIVYLPPKDDEDYVWGRKLPYACPYCRMKFCICRLFPLPIPYPHPYPPIYAFNKCMQS